MDTLSITSTVKKYPKKLPYKEIKKKILGDNYQLSLAFVGSKRAASLNKNYRRKSYVPNVLSFPLDKKCGEIIICQDIPKSEAKKYGLSPTGYIAFLYIHGLLHLKGHEHGDTMDKLENKYLKLFGIK